jgi:hypothetical protein
MADGAQGGDGMKRIALLALLVVAACATPKPDDTVKDEATAIRLVLNKCSFFPKYDSDNHPNVYHADYYSDGTWNVWMGLYTCHFANADVSAHTGAVGECQIIVCDE